MLFYLMFGLFLLALTAGLPIVISRFSPHFVSTQALANLRRALLFIAGIMSAMLTLISLAAAAWGMNTQLPWGLGISMYLLPALSLPAFLLLTFTSATNLSLVLWVLAVCSSIAFYLGDQAERVSTGLQPISGLAGRLGMFFNAFTLGVIGIAVLVQVSSLSKAEYASVGGQPDTKELNRRSHDGSPSDSKS